MTPFAARYGPWALITGAAQGLGAELARQCAAAGLDLLLCDRQADRLAATAAAIRDASAVRVEERVVDLGAPDFAAALAAPLAELEIGLLITCAAAAPIHRFLTAPIAEHLAVIDVNIRSTLVLTHRCAERMAARGRGGIILVSSASALTGAAPVASYAASKAWALTLAESLGYELRPRGIDVLGVMPGLTRTPATLDKDPDLAGRGVPVMEVGPTARETLAALGRRSSLVVGWRNRLAHGLLSRVLPRRWAVALVSRATERIFQRHLEREDPPSRGG